MNRDALPAIRVALREFRLYINQATLLCLENPAYLQFLFEGERKLLVIAGCVQKKEHAYKIPDRIYRDADDECCVSRVALTEAFRLRMNWDKHENYRVTGDFSPNIEMVVFNLSKAVIVGKEDDK